MLGRIPSLVVAAVLVAGCGSIEGDVRDGVTGRALSNARVELHYSDDPSGFFGKPKVMNTVTDDRGGFAFSQSGGNRLEVVTDDGRQTTASPCARSPFTIYVGGPYPGLKLTRPLVLNSAGTPEAGEIPQDRKVFASELGLSASDQTGDDAFSLSLAAEGGIAFVEGTGSVPSAPALPYEKALDLDLRNECGWIFVAQGGRIVAVIEARPLGISSEAGGYRESTLMFAELP